MNFNFNKLAKCTLLFCAFFSFAASAQDKAQNTKPTKEQIAAFYQEKFYGPKTDAQKLVSDILKSTCVKNCDEKNIQEKGEWPHFFLKTNLKAEDVMPLPLIPLSILWQAGASEWTDEQRLNYMKDPESWMIMDSSYPGVFKGPNAEKLKGKKLRFECFHGQKVIEHMNKYKLPQDKQIENAVKEVCEEAKKISDNK